MAENAVILSGLVVLPWAPNAGSAASPGQSTTAAPSHSHPVSMVQKGAGVQTEIETSAFSVAPREERTQFGIALGRLGLPYQPFPEIPDADRVEFDQEALSSAAIVLDVLATHLADIKAGPSTLKDFVQALRVTAIETGPNEKSEDALLDAARGEIGQARGGILKILTGAAAGFEELPEEYTEVSIENSGKESENRQTQSYAEDVTEAIDRLSALAELAADDLVLRHETQAQTQYKQA